MTQVKPGDKVTVNYIGKLEDGSVFDTTENRGPLEVVVGEHQLIKGFQEALVGMSPGESKTVELSPEEAYGPHRDEMCLTVERSQIPPDLEPHVGQRLELKQQNGQPVRTVVTEVTDSSVTLDANHPLAGRSLTFEISLVEVA